MAVKTADQEVWKRILQSDKFYEISNLGRVRNGKTMKILTPRPTKTGYLRIHISVGNGRKDFYIHRLVAEAFCNHPQNCDIVNHLDNDITNNCASNLEWTTQTANIDYCQKQGRASRLRIPVIGTKNQKETWFPSIFEAAKMTNCHSSDISKCCRGLRYSTPNGYTWRCANE